MDMDLGTTPTELDEVTPINSEESGDRDDNRDDDTEANGLCGTYQQAEPPTGNSEVATGISCWCNFHAF